MDKVFMEFNEFKFGMVEIIESSNDYQELAEALKKIADKLSKKMQELKEKYGKDAKQESEVKE